MNFDYNQERGYSYQGKNYNDMTDIYNVKRKRFHYLGRPDNNFMEEIVIGNDQNGNSADEREIRIINDYKIRIRVNRNNEIDKEIIPQRNIIYNNYKYDNISNKYENRNCNNSYENYNMNYKNDLTNNFGKYKKNDIIINYNLNRSSNYNNRKSESDLYKLHYNYNQNSNSKDRNVNIKINNDNNKINIEKINNDYLKRHKSYNNIRLDKQTNEINEGKKFNTITKYSYNIKNKQKNQTINYAKYSNNDFNKENNEYIQKKDLSKSKNIQITRNFNKPLEQRSHHSFKYINQNSEKKENKDKHSYITNNIKYNNYKTRVVPKPDLLESYKKNINFENKYENSGVKKEQIKYNSNVNNRISNYSENRNINHNYKPIFRQEYNDNIKSRQNNKDSNEIIGHKYENKRNNVNNNDIDEKYRNFLRKEILKENKNYLYDIKNKPNPIKAKEFKSKENINYDYKKNYGNIFYKEIKMNNMTEKNILNDENKYIVKAKIIKKNETVDYKISKDYNINRNKENISKEKDQLLSKYNFKKEIKKSSSEQKYRHNKNLNYNYDLSKNNNNNYYNNTRNSPEKNISRDYLKENKDNQISKNMNLTENKANKFYEDSSLTKYKTEYIFNNEKQKKYKSIDKNNLPKKKSYQDIFQNEKRETNNLFENKNTNINNIIDNKNNLHFNNDDLINSKKVITIRTTQIINDNIYDKYEYKIKDGKITKRIITPALENQKDENVLVNNFIRDNNNAHKNITNNYEFHNNFKINNKNQLNNKNYIPNNINPINKERRTLSPEQIQVERIRNQMLDNNNILTNNIQGTKKNKSSNNIIINNNINKSNNNNKNQINKNLNQVDSNQINNNFNNTNIKQICSFGNGRINNNVQIFNNKINSNTPIKNNYLVNSDLQSNNYSKTNNIINNESKNRNLSPPLQNNYINKNNNYNYINNRIHLENNNIRNNIGELKQFNSNNQNQIVKNNSSPNLRTRNEIVITKKYANGLQNIGATCYMNATLQCLAHVENLTKHLLQRKENIKSKKLVNQLTYSFLEVLENLWVNNGIKDYAPINFKDIISKMNPLFKGVQANDSKDLVIFLLETMHNELNKVRNVKQYDDSNIDQYNFYNSLNSFINYFKSNYQSVISDIFYGMYNSQMKCLNCNVITHNIQCYNILIIPLEEVRKFKQPQNNMVNIKDCFEYNQKFDYMSRQNQTYCNKCKQKSNSVNNTALIVGPKVLILNLNRGKGIQFNVKLNFDEYIDINEFIYFKNTPNKYKLIGVVTNFGPSSISGHFIAFCKSFIDGNWYKYNDSIVSLSNFQEAKTTGIPYILFYSAV